MNDAMRRFETLVGEWDVTMTHAWFFDSLDTEVKGTATFEWVADAFLVMTSSLEEGSWASVFTRSDARDTYLALYCDDRGVYRVFDMTFADGEWTMLCEDPDFHQRIVMRIQPDRIDMGADASEDAGESSDGRSGSLETRAPSWRPLAPSSSSQTPRSLLRNDTASLQVIAALSATGLLLPERAREQRRCEWAVLDRPSGSLEQRPWNLVGYSLPVTPRAIPLSLMQGVVRVYASHDGHRG
jgi:hypothetical protein